MRLTRAQIFLLHRIGREIYVSLDDDGAVAFGNYGSIPDGFGQTTLLVGNAADDFRKSTPLDALGSAGFPSAAGDYSAKNRF